MTFEEFFKKKRIDLVALEQGMHALFSEFKTHFEQMGEKSFDHTKKYWFNKLRRQFPLAPEVKTEKAHIANPLAEQTVTESLVETVAAAPVPKLGFVPKFKAGALGKPAVSEAKNEESAMPDISVKAESSPETIPALSTPKLGFTPKFKAGVKSKPTAALNEKNEEDLPIPPAESEASTAPTPPKPKLGFTPKFKAGVTNAGTRAVSDKIDEPLKQADAATPPEVSEVAVSAAPALNLGFTPKFKAGNLKKPVVDEKVEDTATEVAALAEDTDAPQPEANEPAKPTTEHKVAKPAYRPKFNMKNLPPKKGE